MATPLPRLEWVFGRVQSLALEDVFKAASRRRLSLCPGLSTPGACRSRLGPRTQMGIGALFMEAIAAHVGFDHLAWNPPTDSLHMRLY